MNIRNELLCIWSAVLFVIIFTIGIWPLTHFLPPHLPTASAEEIAALYQDRTWQIRLGLFLMMGCSGLVCAFVAAITVAMKRMERGAGPLTYTQLSAGSLGAVLLIIPCLVWTVAAFRPDRDPQLTLLLNDMGWIMLFMPFTTFVVQNIAIGLAILGDRNATPVMPRWVGFLNLWVAVLFVPGGLLTFFKKGPFAWSGVFVYWVPLVVFLGWYLVMFAMLRMAAINAHHESRLAASVLALDAIKADQAS